MRFHAAGKVALDHIYTRSDPRAYFGTLRELEYGIPGLARPHFLGLIEELRHLRAGDRLTVVDIGCSYGINGALLRCAVTMDELYERYCAFGDDVPGEAVLAHDRELVATGGDQPGRLRIVGLDIAGDALAYGLAAGFLDDAVHADLEADDPTPQQRAALAGADLVISTGCLGYVTGSTLARVAGAAEALPWMAHTVLRMYPFEPIGQRLAELGYETVVVDGFLRQRRFASAEEQAGVLKTLADLGIDPTGLEDDGWLYAQLYVSRPRPSTVVVAPRTGQ